MKMKERFFFSLDCLFDFRSVSSLQHATRQLPTWQRLSLDLVKRCLMPRSRQLGPEIQCRGTHDRTSVATLPTCPIGWARLTLIKK
jgi:hypothetical protein